MSQCTENGFAIHLISYHCTTRLCAAIIITVNNILIAKPDSLFEHDLRGSLAVHAEVAIRQFDDSAHGLPDRVEGVDFVKLLLWDLVSYWLVIPLQVQDQSQQTALCLVAHLLRQTAFLIWGLERGRGKVYFQPNIWCDRDTVALSSCSCFSLNFSLQVLII